MVAVFMGAVSALLSFTVLLLWRKVSGAQAAESARAVAEAKFAQVSAAYENTKVALEEADDARERAERGEALALQKAEQMAASMGEFEALKLQFEQLSKAALREATTALIEDSRKERVEAQKQYVQFAKTATEPLFKSYEQLMTTMGKVQGQVDTSSAQLGVLVRAMKNPIGAGAEGEIAFNNLLQQLGLTAGQDYDLQLHLAGETGNLRPDGVIYMPHDQVLVIDAKASQHIYALYEAEGTPEAAAVFDRVRASMKQHIKALAGKAYREEVARMLKARGRAASRVMLVMFVPNDEVITRLRRADAELTELLGKSDIMLVGPATLPAVFHVASTLIREARRQDEHHAIMELTQGLMGDIITALGHVQKISNGIGTSANAFNDFSRSVNSGVLRKLRHLYDKGLHPAKNRAIPANLPHYEIHKAESEISGEAEEIVPVLALGKEDAA
ncbi:MAG: DNA recombination protein RmuC [Alphaproteobacteria bacterium]